MSDLTILQGQFGAMQIRAESAERIATQLRADLIAIKKKAGYWDCCQALCKANDANGISELCVRRDAARVECARLRELLMGAMSTADAMRNKQCNCSFCTEVRAVLTAQLPTANRSKP